MAVTCAGWFEVGGSNGSLRCWLWGGDAWLLMAVPDTGCEGGDVLVLMALPDAGGGERRGFSSIPDAGCGLVRGRGPHGNPRPWLWEEGRGGVLMAVPDAGCGGRREAGVLNISPRHICVEERRGFSWQSQTLFLWRRGGGSNGISDARFGLEAAVLMVVPEAGCGGEDAGVLMAVPDDGCGTERQGFSCHSQTLVVGEQRRLFSWQSQTLVVGVGGVGSNGNLRCWFWGGEEMVLMALPEAGCGGEEAGVLMPLPLVVGEGDVLVLMAVPDTGCGGERRVFSW